MLEAFTFATDTIRQLFDSMAVDVAASIDTCADEFNEAIERALRE